MVAQAQNLGLGNIVDAFLAYATRARYMQWGVGSGQAVTDTDLNSKTGTTEARTAGSTAKATTTTTDDTIQITGTITALGTRAITELGVFDAAGAGSPPAGGNMCFYGDFTTINLGTGDYIEFTLSVVLDQG